MLANILERRGLEVAPQEPAHQSVPASPPPAPSAWLLSLHRLQEAGAPGNNQERPLVVGEKKTSWEWGRGENCPQSDFWSPTVSSASSQPWPELMNLREQSCLLFVCHFEVFWLIKI